MYTTLISVEQLQALRASGQPHTVFDCSFLLTDPPAGEAMFQHTMNSRERTLRRHQGVNEWP